MSTKSPSVPGICPQCHAEIAGFDVLIEYTTETGETAVWAACPGCDDVVHPEGPV